MGITDVNPQGCKINLRCCRPLALGILDREDFLGFGWKRGSMVILGVITSPDDIQSRWGALNSFKAGIKKCNNPVKSGGLKGDLGKKCVFKDWEM